MLDILSWSQQCKISKILMDLLWVIGEFIQITLAGLIQQVWDSLGQFGTIRD